MFLIKIIKIIIKKDMILIKIINLLLNHIDKQIKKFLNLMPLKILKYSQLIKS